jgi:PAS domain S-box-containing protein
VAGTGRAQAAAAPERADEYMRLLDHVEDAVIEVDADFVVTAWSRGAELLYGWTAEEVLGRRVGGVIRFAMSDAQRARMRRRTAAEGRVRLDAVAFRRDGTQVDVEAIAVAVRGAEGRLTGFLGIHRDIGERKRLEREQRGLLQAARVSRRRTETVLHDRERRAAQQALVAELGLGALSSDDMQALMDTAAGLLASNLAVDLVGVAEILPGGGELLLRAGVGWRPGVVGTMTGSAGRGSLVGYTVAAGAPVVSADLIADERFRISGGLARERPVSAVTVVIATRDEPYGVLGVFSRRPRSFSEDDVHFLQAVANVIAAAVQHARSTAHIVEVRELERRRIARELHDGALQDLACAVAEARSPVETDAAGAERLARLVPALERVGERLRAAVHDLRLGRDEDGPFGERIRALVEVHEAIAGAGAIELDLGAGVPSRSLGAKGTELLRIMGEALTNVRRHAAARRVLVRVWGSERRLCAEVSDDGRGFEAGGVAAAQGSGIRGMRERADLIDAELVVASARGTGTKVRVEVPLRTATGAEPVRVLLVEDHAAVREAIASALERDSGMRVVAQAASLREARAKLDDVDVAVVDLGLPDGYGADLIGDLRQANPGAQALVLSATLDRAELARAIEAGAAGALSKSANFDEVIGAVRRVHAGEMLLSIEEIVELLHLAGRRREREHADREAIAGLTPREREVLQAVAEALDAQQIAERLSISIRTERNHVASILTKLGVHSQLQALVFALRYEVVDIR